MLNLAHPCLLKWAQREKLHVSVRGCEGQFSPHPWQFFWLEGMCWALAGEEGGCISTPRDGTVSSSP